MESAWGSFVCFLAVPGWRASIAMQTMELNSFGWYLCWKKILPGGESRKVLFQLLIMKYSEPCGENLDNNVWNFVYLSQKYHDKNYTCKAPMLMRDGPDKGGASNPV